MGINDHNNEITFSMNANKYFPQARTAPYTHTYASLMQSREQQPAFSRRTTYKANTLSEKRYKSCHWVSTFSKDSPLYLKGAALLIQKVHFSI